ncbi:MAG TPA: TetR/AcrR family transcriptional regulator [Opitutaceae bacterium]
MTEPSSRRQRLLSAGNRLFSKWGYDKTSVDEIAAEAGVSKGGVYLEFADKDALFKAVVHDAFATYADDWLRRFTADPGDWSFARMFQHSLAAMNATPLVKALLTRDTRIYGTFLRREPELLAMTQSARSDFFGQMQAAGAMRRDIPAPVLAQLMTLIGYGFVAGMETLPTGSSVPLEESLRGLALLLDRGLADPERSNPVAARALIEGMTIQVRDALRSAPPP